MLVHGFELMTDKRSQKGWMAMLDKFVLFVFANPAD
jgi:hypothetical protein